MTTATKKAAITVERGHIAHEMQVARELQGKAKAAHDKHMLDYATGYLEALKWVVREK